MQIFWGYDSLTGILFGKNQTRKYVWIKTDVISQLNVGHLFLLNFNVYIILHLTLSEIQNIDLVSLNT